MPATHVSEKIQAGVVSRIDFFFVKKYKMEVNLLFSIPQSKFIIWFQEKPSIHVNSVERSGLAGEI